MPIVSHRWVKRSAPNEKFIFANRQNNNDGFTSFKPFTQLDYLREGIANMRNRPVLLLIGFLLTLNLVHGCLCFKNLYAVPAYDGLFELKQPSGKTFEARQRGDEWYNWVETKDGYGIYKNDKTGNWEYYLPSSNKTHPQIGVRGHPPHQSIVGEVDPASIGIPKGLRPRKISIKGCPRTDISPAVGDRNLLVIAVDYEDQPHTYTEDEIQLEIFGEEGSVADYYHDVSYSSVTIIPAEDTIFDSKFNTTIKDGFIGWLRLEGTHPNPDGKKETKKERIEQIVKQETIAKDAIMAADRYIDYSNYDFNKNNIIEPTELSIMVIVAGYEAAGNEKKQPSVWGHKSCMADVGYPIVDGKTIEQYAEFGEIHAIQGDHLATIGVMAHELGHLMFSLPDLYDTIPTKNPDSSGVGDFCLMGSGAWGSPFGADPGSSPTHLCAWSKESLEWGTVDTITSSQLVSFPKADGYPASIFRVDTSDPNQYFLVENRQFTGYDIGFQKDTGSWTSSAYGHGGLVIYHIDKLKTELWPEKNEVNADVNDKGVDVEEANEGREGTSMLDDRISKALTEMFYFQENNVSFTDNTVPDSKLKKGKSTNISVTNISTYGDIMTAYVTPQGDNNASITVTSPNGGENWQAGSTQKITWTYTGNPGPNVKIELLKGTASSTITSSTTTGSNGNGSYIWTLPTTQTTGSDYKIRITSTSNSSYTDTSNGNFTIGTTGITVTSPNGGENWQAGSTQKITWTYTGDPGPSVKIELLKGTSVNSTITSSTSIGSNGSGSYIWTIPSDQASGSDYKIRITSTSNSSYTDTSDGNFTIGGGTIPTITSINPTSGTAGTSVTINGKNFGTTQGTSTVKFGTVTATVTSWSDTKIVAIAPTNSGTVNVTVTTTAGASNGVPFTYNDNPPRIDSVSPNPVIGSNIPQPFNIYGKDFVSGCNVTLRTGSEIYPNRPISSFSSTAITINPNFTTTAATWTVEVINPDGKSSGQFTFQVIAPFTPRIDSVSPNPVIGSNIPQPFNIYGKDFVSGCNVTLRTGSEIYPNRPISSFSSTAITINPNFTTTAATWTVEVINPDGKSSGQFTFQVIAPFTPRIDSVSPNPVIGSNIPQPFNIYGKDFVSGCNVTLRTGSEIYPNRPISSFSSTAITINPNFTTTAATWTVEVINPDGQSSGQFYFTVIAPPKLPPYISSVSPNPVIGSNIPQPFNIYGKDFVSGCNVTLRTGSEIYPNRPISSFSSTAITINPNFTTTAATWTVEVINPDGQSSGQFYFTVIAPPKLPPYISSVSPNPVIGFNSQQPFNIYGKDFVSGCNVTLRTGSEIYPNRPISSFSSTAITINPNFTTTAATWTVEVINPDGQSSGQFYFTVIAPPKLPPYISSVSPNPVIGFNSQQPFNIYGKDFVSGCNVTLRTGSEIYPNRPISSFSSTAITINPNFTTTAATWTVEVINPDGQSSGQFYFTVIAPPKLPPYISSVSPNPVIGSNSQQPFNIYGKDFVSGCNVTLRTGSEIYPNRPISSFSSTAITINPNFTTTAATWTVEVINPDGKSSGQFYFTVIAPPKLPPYISSVSPNPVIGSNIPQPFNIYGKDFVSGCNVTLRTGSEIYPNRPISSFSSTAITINPNFTTTAATWTVEVINPDGQSSGQFYFTVIAPPKLPPYISSVSPNPVIGSNSQQPFNIYGKDFVSGCNVTLRTGSEIYPNRPISSFSSTAITINPNFTTTAATWTVEVINPDGQSSGQFYFTVIAPPKLPPYISSVSPNPVIGF